MKKYPYAVIAMLVLASCAQAQCFNGSCGVQAGFSFGAYSVQQAPVFLQRQAFYQPQQQLFVQRQAFSSGYGVGQNVFLAPQQFNGGGFGGSSTTIINNNQQRGLFGGGGLFGRNRNGGQQIIQSSNGFGGQATIINNRR